MASKGCPLIQLDKTQIDSRDAKEVERLTEILRGEFESVLSAAAFRGGPQTDFLRSLRDVDRYMRANYIEFGNEIGLNLKPMIVLNDGDPGEEGIGTTITYYGKSGEIRRYTPTPPMYEMYKNLSHLVFGTFSFIAPYLKSPNSLGLVDKLKKVQIMVQTSLAGVAGAGLTADMIEPAEKILNMTNDYMENLIQNRNLTLDSFRQYVMDDIPYCERIMKKAVELQTNALITQLRTLKQEMGDDWEETYFAIPTCWSVDGINVRTQVLETLCTEKHLATHLIKLQNILTVDEARKMVGRVVGDRAIAAGAFYRSEEDNHMFALSTSQDLLSDFANDEVKAILAKEKN